MIRKAHNNGFLVQKGGFNKIQFFSLQKTETVENKIIVTSHPSLYYK